MSILALFVVMFSFALYFEYILKSDHFFPVGEKRTPHCCGKQSLHYLQVWFLLRSWNITVIEAQMHPRTQRTSLDCSCRLQIHSLLALVLLCALYFTKFRFCLQSFVKAKHLHTNLRFCFPSYSFCELTVAGRRPANLSMSILACLGSERDA